MKASAPALTQIGGRAALDEIRRNRDATGRRRQDLRSAAGLLAAQLRWPSDIAFLPARAGALFTDMQDALQRQCPSERPEACREAAAFLVGVEFGRQLAVRGGAR